MSLRFIHTADWQIGAPFGEFGDERTRTLLREARLTAIDRIALAAMAAGARHVLVAGDVFDSQSVADQLMRQTAARLAKYTGLAWHLLPGNHDHVRAGGVWDRLIRTGLPGNVVLHTRPEPYVLESDAVLLPAPLSAKSSSLDPMQWIDTAATPPGSVRIGLAHGSIRGFGSDQQAAQQIDPARAQRAGLAYLALGDWHGLQRISDHVWYSGTPEPDGYRDNQPGHVLSVAVGAADSAARPHVQVASVRTAHFAWTERTVVVDQLTDWRRFVEDLHGAGHASDPPRDRQLLKLVMRGAVTLSERSAMEEDLASLEPALFHLEADLTGLLDRAAEGDLEGLSDEGVRALAIRLQAMSTGGDDHAGRAAARLALRKLIRLDAQMSATRARPAARTGGDA